MLCHANMALWYAAKGHIVKNRYNTINNARNLKICPSVPTSQNTLLVMFITDVCSIYQVGPRRVLRQKKEEETTNFIKKTLLPYPRLG